MTGEQLSLYFGIGGYVSANSREGTWGTGAIERISEQLRRELPGLRGFSASSIKDMRAFYEYWCQYINRQPLAVDLQITENKNEEIAYRVILRKLTQRVNNFYNRF